MTESKISFSELKVWSECPFKHKLVYVDKIDKFKGNEYTAFGSALHAVCEKKILNEDLDEIDLFNSSFDEEIQNLKEIGIELNLELLDSMRPQGLDLCKLAIPELRKFFGPI